MARGEFCRPREWPHLAENGIAYTVDMVGFLAPFVVFGELDTNRITNLSEIRVKEILKHENASGIDQLLFRKRKGFLQPRKISLNCRVKRVRGVRGKRDRRLYFLQKVPDSDHFRLMYPPTVRGNRNVSRRAAREKIADAICDVRTSCTEPSICTKPCQPATRPAIKYFGRTPFDRQPSDDVRYVHRDERFFLLCNLEKAKIDPTVSILKDGRLWTEKVMRMYRFRQKGVHHRITAGPFDFRPHHSGNWTCQVGYANTDKKGRKQVRTESLSIQYRINPGVDIIDLPTGGPLMDAVCPANQETCDAVKCSSNGACCRIASTGEQYCKCNSNFSGAKCDQLQVVKRVPGIPQASIPLVIICIISVLACVFCGLWYYKTQKDNDEKKVRFRNFKNSKSFKRESKNNGDEKIQEDSRSDLVQETQT